MRSTDCIFSLVFIVQSRRIGDESLSLRDSDSDDTRVQDSGRRDDVEPMRALEFRTNRLSSAISNGSLHAALERSSSENETLQERNTSAEGERAEDQRWPRGAMQLSLIKRGPESREELLKKMKAKSK